MLIKYEITHRELFHQPVLSAPPLRTAGICWSVTFHVALLTTTSAF